MGTGAPHWAAELLLDLSQASVPRRQTKAAQVEESIRQAIQSGRLSPGSRMPPSRALADELACSRSVVVSAYERLAAQGFLRSRRGSGTVVANVSQPPVSTSVPRQQPPQHRFNFTAGVADLSMFPRSEWSSAVRHVMSTASRDEFRYNAPNGIPQFREALSQRLARVRGVVADAHDIHACSGTVQSLSLLAHTLAGEGHRSIAVEDPSWDMVRPPLAAAGLRLVPIGVDDDGVCVSELWEHPDVRAVVVTPAHQFPLGAVMSQARRTELLRWAQARDAVIIEDDYDAEFSYGRRSRPALQPDAPDRVVYLGTTSKILSPALRLGWMVTPAWMTPCVSTIRASFDLGVPALEQLSMTYLITTGTLDRHLRRTRPKYDRRRRALISALHAELDDVEVSSAPAGLHLLARFPHGCSEGRLVAEAARRSVSVLGLAPYRLVDPPQSRPTLVLGYANMTENLIVSGVQELARAWREICGSTQRNREDSRPDGPSQP
ncbi:PLP-dependent aminotransferase family protein [Streptomyces sp. NPDC001508]|uniref:MocR-like pyridoxine biosynthesis transcription factor PdxR n=1 Tax=Streptomyces sp. NPDC001508 TaxID=3154656 RepID=UPI00331E141D